MTTINETAAPGCTPKAARDLEKPSDEFTEKPRGEFTAAPVASFADARRRRAAALLRDKDVPDQEEERRAWGDPPRDRA
jgi:hypothetical protein